MTKVSENSHDSEHKSQERDTDQIKKEENFVDFNGEQPQQPLLPEEEIENLDLNNEKVKILMERYERETDKKAIWRGTVTESFKTWLRGGKIYARHKERISLYVTEEAKETWQEFINDHEEFPTFSELIRQSVNTFIEDTSRNADSLTAFNEKTISNISHALKEPLTSIKGYSQFLYENESYRDKLTDDVKDKLKSILEQSNLLENRIVGFLDNIKSHNHEYDILLVEDDLSTIRLLTSYFESKGVICKGVVSGSKGLEEVERTQPGVILLDIILPDLNGYDICKEIRSRSEYDDIPIYFLTAISASEVEKHMKDTKADGYILKPFNFSDFDVIFDILNGKN